MIREPTILYEDNHILVIDKPAGLLSQGDISGESSVVTWAQAYLGRPYVGLVHRLDRNTSGVMVLGKRTKASQRLSDGIKKGEFIKEYLALVLGSPATDSPEELSNFLRKNESTRVVEVVASTTPHAQIARLEYTTLKTLRLQDASEAALLKVKLYTGRFHQIRAQLAHAGFPLLGDQKYGGSKCARHAPRVALHAHTLTFAHPMSKEKLVLVAPWPQDLSSIATPGGS